MTLHDAARTNDLEALEELVSAGADVDDTHAPAHERPLHVAAREGKEDIARYLLSHGAEVDARDDLLVTPLGYASYYNHLPVIRILVAAGADVNAVDAQGDHPLGAAAWMENVDAVRVLLEAGADASRPLHRFIAGRWMRTVMDIVAYAAGPDRKDALWDLLCEKRPDEVMAWWTGESNRAHP